jgi:hypothetical protein
MLDCADTLGIQQEIIPVTNKILSFFILFFKILINAYSLVADFRLPPLCLIEN